MQNCNPSVLECICGRWGQASPRGGAGEEETAVGSGRSGAAYPVSASSPEREVRSRLCYSAGRRPLHGGRGRSSPGA